MTDDPTDLEINAYVDDQLDPVRRFAVETHLSRHPSRAAQVMDDLSVRSALALLTGDVSPVQGGEVRRTPRRKPLWRRAAPLGASIVGVAVAAAGFIALSEGPPGYVDYAVTSHRIAMMRAVMDSQNETPHFDSQEIALRTRIAIPKFPQDWRVTDVQLFPTNKGPALLVAVRTEEGQKLSIFAVREKTGAPERPDAIREGEQSVAYWRRGDMSYALTGEQEPGAIDATAEALARYWS
ncbi:Transmembrane transcriptional regulator (anti-sigma factor RsiW) [Sphingobium faniae]|nr:Transmembrane transcriptional regulator (anti-sigma factor RsiW) [Sphingobium faniae]